MTTQKAFFSYEEVIDLHTESDRVSVIGIHTPTGDTPRKLCPGFFAQFKKYKYLGCKVALVPAATLPADPLSVSYESAEPSIDPRDMLNPILFHGCHGNDLGNILNRIYSSGSVSGSDLSQILHSDSTDLWNLFNNPDQDDTLTGTNLLESLYYRALTDKTWKKANVQRGFRIAGLRPRVYSLATNMYLQNATALGTSNVAPAPFSGDFGEGEFIDEWKPFADETANPVRYFTPRTVPLGWLDTRAVVGYTPDDRTAVPDAGLDPILKGIVGAGTVDVTLPKIFMGVIMLPPAYKTEMYFRMVINHYFAFAGFRGVSMSNDMLENPNVFDWNDALVDGDSDDPEPEPEPDPDPEPTPSGPPADATYPCVFLSEQQDSTKYSKAEYYTAADTVTVSIEFPNDGGAFSVGTSAFAVGKPVLTTIGTKGNYIGKVCQIQCSGSNSVAGVRNGESWGSISNVSDIQSFLGGVIDSSAYAITGTGTDGKAMFLSTTIYKVDDA